MRGHCFRTNRATGEPRGQEAGALFSAALA